MGSCDVDKVVGLLRVVVLRICEQVIPYNVELNVGGTLTVEADGIETCTLTFKEYVTKNSAPQNKSREKADADQSSIVGCNGQIITSPLNSFNSSSQFLSTSQNSMVNSLIKEAMKLWYDESLTPEHSKEKENLGKRRLRNRHSNSTPKKRKKRKGKVGGAGISPQSHIKTSSVDNNNTPHQCSLCSLQFTLAAHLVRHQKKFHNQLQKKISVDVENVELVPDPIAFLDSKTNSVSFEIKSQNLQSQPKTSTPRNSLEKASESGLLGIPCLLGGSLCPDSGFPPVVIPTNFSCNLCAINNFHSADDLSFHKLQVHMGMVDNSPSLESGSLNSSHRTSYNTHHTDSYSLQSFTDDQGLTRASLSDSSGPAMSRLSVDPTHSVETVSSCNQHQMPPPVITFATPQLSQEFYRSHVNSRFSNNSTQFTPLTSNVEPSFLPHMSLQPLPQIVDPAPNLISVQPVQTTPKSSTSHTHNAQRLPQIQDLPNIASGQGSINVLPPQKSIEYRATTHPVQPGEASQPLVQIPEGSEYVQRYTCVYCSRRFPLYQNLGRHMKVVHGQNVVDVEMQREIPVSIENTEGSHTCSLCSHSFACSPNLRRHMRKVHDRSMPATGSATDGKPRAVVKKTSTDTEILPSKFKCTMCNAAFTFSSNLTRHLRKVHKMIKSQALANWQQPTQASTGEGKTLKIRNNKKDKGNSSPKKVRRRCKLCSVRFKSSAELHQHSKNCAATSTDAQKKQQSSSSNTKTRDHSHKHLPSLRRHTCQLCHATFTLRTNLTRHLKKQHDTVPTGGKFS